MAATIERAMKQQRPRAHGLFHLAVCAVIDHVVVIPVKARHRD